MRLRTVIWVKAYIRRCEVAGFPAAIVRHGDDDAGAIFIRINRLDGTSDLFTPAPAGLDEADSDRQWVHASAAAPEPDERIEHRLSREASFDPDLWIVEVEAPKGDHMLEGWIANFRG
ncbi:MAG: DUF1491 family protein [Hyphomicrobium sp.]|nr:DUF1491 family protein [Hyphomicrobium sp.]